MNAVNTNDKHSHGESKITHEELRVAVYARIDFIEAEMHRLISAPGVSSYEAQAIRDGARNAQDALHWLIRHLRYDDAAATNTARRPGQ